MPTERKADTALERAEDAWQQANSEYEDWKKENEGMLTVSGNKAILQEKKALEENLKSIGYQKEDAMTDRQEALTGAARKLEDAMTAEQADSTLQVSRLERKALQKELDKYTELYNAGCQIDSKGKGTITKVNLTAGEKTPEGAAIVYADEEVSYQFEVLIDKEQKKYVNQGDSVLLKTAKGKKELVADYLTEEENSPGTYRVVIYLPKGKGRLE